jgi:hypothetical protein
MIASLRGRAVGPPLIAFAALLAFGSAGSAKWLYAGPRTKCRISNPACFGYYPTCWDAWPAECPHCGACQPTPLLQPSVPTVEPTPPPAEAVGPPTKIRVPAAPPVNGK